MTRDFSARSVHHFHIPVMGTGFTIDTPLQVAKFGIDSVISLVDDHLIETTRRFHTQSRGQTFDPIEKHVEDARSLRITAYLNWIATEIKREFVELRDSPFGLGSPIARYFELLPNGPLRDAYRQLAIVETESERRQLESQLRSEMRCGSIDVNIMTKLNRTVGLRGEALDYTQGDAFSALRGFAQSNLCSAVVFSAGFSPQLYTYLADFDDFYPDCDGNFRKRVILKVSDFRSALVQGKFFAKKGIWVSEYRVESGLNCGGHAFPTKGLLLGPILDEFLRHRDSIQQQCFKLLCPALLAKQRAIPNFAPELKISAQGGVGTASEHQALLDDYNVDSVGWGTPFLLAPEITRVDEETREKLRMSSPAQVTLSNNSPLGVPFWNLVNSSSESARRDRISRNRPGSTCPLGYAATETSNTGLPWCRASRAYQSRALVELEGKSLTVEQHRRTREEIVAKSCICHDLGGSVRILMQGEVEANVAVCPGPNIVNFNRFLTLKEVVAHIYGRCEVPISGDRPNMFVREIELYLEYFAKLAVDCDENGEQPTEAFHDKFINNLAVGIKYYRDKWLSHDLQSCDRPNYNLLGKLEEKCRSLAQWCVDRRNDCWKDSTRKTCVNAE